MRYGTGSIVMFDCAERNSLVKQSEQSPFEIFSDGDSVQIGSQATFLVLFALSYGMTARTGINILKLNVKVQQNCC